MRTPRIARTGIAARRTCGAKLVRSCPAALNGCCVRWPSSAITRPAGVPGGGGRWQRTDAGPSRKSAAARRPRRLRSPRSVPVGSAGSAVPPDNPRHRSSDSRRARGHASTRRPTSGARTRPPTHGTTAGRCRSREGRGTAYANAYADRFVYRMIASARMATPQAVSAAACGQSVS